MSITIARGSKLQVRIILSSENPKTWLLDPSLCMGRNIDDPTYICAVFHQLYSSHQLSIIKFCGKMSISFFAIVWTKLFSSHSFFLFVFVCSSLLMHHYLTCITRAHRWKLSSTCNYFLFLDVMLTAVSRVYQEFSKR